jgi:ABC-type uncharacterized transport system substrate-binding protein
MFAKELLALQPDVILAVSTPITTALQQETRTVPLQPTLRRHQHREDRREL